MRKLQVCLGFTLLAATACGNDTAKPIDAPSKTADAEMPDAKVYDDAPPPAYRTTFVYPPYPLAATTAIAETLLISTAGFAELEQFAGATQNDASNGVVFVEVTDCADKGIKGATLSVTTTTDTTTQVGTQFNVGALETSLPGVFLVINVPAGAIDVGATYNTTELHTVVAAAYKNGQNGVTSGSVTTTVVRPGYGATVTAPAVVADAAVYDFGCATNTPPTTAPAMVDISGTTMGLSASGSAALPGATVAAYATGSDTPIVPAVTSDGSGDYTISNIPTGGAPLAGYLEANAGN
jgi:hypothetical protein